MAWWDGGEVATRSGTAKLAEVSEIDPAADR
jgi:hypothetical protein